MTKITCVRNESLKSNTYLYVLDDSESCFVIDPGLEPELIIKEIERQGLNPKVILCTHGHFDHIGSAHVLSEKYNIEVYLHKNDKKVANSSNFLMMVCKIKKKIQIPTNVNWLEGDSISFDIDKTKITYHHAPGHTVGSCLVEIGGAVFTGDTLFRSFVVEDSITGSDSATLKNSLLKYIGYFPAKTDIYPGHGKSATLEYIINNNLNLRKFLNLKTDGITEGLTTHEL